MKSYLTSYCRPLCLDIVVEGRGIVFRSVPKERGFNRFLVSLASRSGREVLSNVFLRGGSTRFVTAGVPDGEYYLLVFTSTGRRDRFRGFIHHGELSVRIFRGTPSFLEPWCLRSNAAFIQHFSLAPEAERMMLRSEPQYPCTHPDIVRLAASITRGIDDNYGKMLAVHDWVADNIFYDNDSLRLLGDRVVALDRTTIEVLRTRRAVCKGYSDLAVSLLRACGIPSVSVECFALGQGTGGGWERPENRVRRTNHVFTAAWLRGRSVLMDITWDSDNVYSRGRYRHKTGDGWSRKYFDISSELFSAAHRMVV